MYFKPIGLNFEKITIFVKNLLNAIKK